MKAIRSRGGTARRRWEGAWEGPETNFVSWNFEFTLHIARHAQPVSLCRYRCLNHFCGLRPIIAHVIMLIGPGPAE